MHEQVQVPCDMICVICLVHVKNMLKHANLCKSMQKYTELYKIMLKSAIVFIRFLKIFKIKIKCAIYANCHILFQQPCNTPVKPIQQPLVNTYNTDETTMKV